MGKLKSAFSKPTTVIKRRSRRKMKKILSGNVSRETVIRMINVYLKPHATISLLLTEQRPNQALLSSNV